MLQQLSQVPAQKICLASEMVLPRAQNQKAKYIKISATDSWRNRYNAMV